MKQSLFISIFIFLFLGCMVFSSSYPEEYQKAYSYAYNQGITTVAPIDRANIYGSLDRISMAKMVSNFAINVLGMVPDKLKDCSFEDVTDDLDFKYGYGVTKVCQLGIMGIGSSGQKTDRFNPKGTVNRGQWATVFSRVLSKYNGDIVQEGYPYYKSHLEYLYSKGIIKNLEKPAPNSVEKRGNVMIMMYRVARTVKNYEDEDLIGGFEKNFRDDGSNDDLNVGNISESVGTGKIENNKVGKVGKLNLDNSKQVVYHRVDNSYSQFMMDDFNAVEYVYKNIKSGDRVIFVVRHSERISDCTSEGGLTDYGVELAEGVGKKLRGAPFEDTSTDFYGSSTVKRTVQTSYYVGKSRGSKVLKGKLDDDARNEYDYVNHSSDIDSVVYGNYFSDGNSYSSIEHLYEENKDVINERALDSIEKLCKLTEGHPFSWITSHDWFTLPVTEWATSEILTFSQSKSQWPNFMQGVVIIIHRDGGWEIYPVRALESGIMNTSENPGC